VAFIMMSPCYSVEKVGVDYHREMRGRNDVRLYRSRCKNSGKQEGHFQKQLSKANGIVGIFL